MKHDDTWHKKYLEVLNFLLENRRNPSRHDAQERGKYHNWIKYNKKLLNSGGLKPERAEKFQELLKMVEFYKRVNQWD